MNESNTTHSEADEISLDNAAVSGDETTGETALNEFVTDETMPDIAVPNEVFPVFQVVPAAPTDDEVGERTPIDQEQKLKKITLILLAVGAAASVCLVFFFYTLFNIRNNREIPKIYDARQLSATDSSVLLSWSSSSSADGYRIRMTDDNGAEIVSDCDLPFAVVRNLQPNRDYSIAISALKDGQEYSTESVACSTESFCEVTEIKVNKVGNNFVDLSWQYNGVNQGFEAVAYVLDTQGRRHLTSNKVTISADGKPQCRIKGLAAEMHYTVAVMPLTSYRKVGKSNFTTNKYSKEYDVFNVIRFVICPANAQNTTQVHAVKKIKPASPYKTSLIINGKTDKNHKVDITLLITDAEGRLVDEEVYRDVYTNPEEKQWFIHRSMLFDFNSPNETGLYYMYLMVDGKSIYRINFTVEE